MTQKYLISYLRFNHIGTRWTRHQAEVTGEIELTKAILDFTWEVVAGEVVIERIEIKPLTYRGYTIVQGQNVAKGRVQIYQGSDRLDHAENHHAAKALIDEWLAPA